MKYVHLHRCRDWWDPMGSRETTLVEPEPGLTVGDLADLDTDGAWAVLNGRAARAEDPLAGGDHLTFGAGPANPAAPLFIQLS